MRIIKLPNPNLQLVCVDTNPLIRPLDVPIMWELAHKTLLASHISIVMHTTIMHFFARMLIMTTRCHKMSLSEF
jgi:hypothetical protein